MAGGRAVSDARIADLAATPEIRVELPRPRPEELYVWAHRPTRDGDTQPLPVSVESPEAADYVVLRSVGGSLTQPKVD